MRYILTILILTISIAVQAQTPVGHSKYVVFFKDKANSPYSISNPSAFLSERAITRRTNQGIAINELDIPVNETYINQVQNTGVYILTRSKWLNCITIWVSDTTILPQIAALSFVDNVSPVAYRKPNEEPLKNFVRNVTPKVRTQTKNNPSLPINYGYGTNQAKMLMVDSLHRMGIRGQGMLVAVMDAGFSNVDVLDVFDSLFVNNRIIKTKDFVNPGNHDVYQFNTHGTYVLSCMAANQPGVLVGTAPDADYLLIRTEEAATEHIIEEYNWAAGIEFADSMGVDVVNSSLGYTVFDDTTQSHTYADMDGQTCPSSRAASIAGQKGILVCNSAGNSGTGSWFYLGAPSDAENIISVGAVDSLGVYASFSSKGPSADGRIKPNLAAQGRATWVAGLSGGSFSGNGTSFASPVLAGAVTCLWQANPSYTNLQIINAAQQSANRATNPDSLTGYGIPDMAKANNSLTVGLATKNAKQGEVLKVFPNPFQNTINVVFHSLTAKEVKLIVADNQGKKINERNFKIAPNTCPTLSIDGFEKLSPGTYTVTAIAGKSKTSKVIVKQ